MFNNYTVKQLRQLISNYKKVHNIKNYSKLKKNELVNLLTARFTIKNNELYERGTSIINNPSSKSAGQQRYESAINKIASKANYYKDSTFAKRLRGGF